MLKISARPLLLPPTMQWPSSSWSSLLRWGIGTCTSPACALNMTHPHPQTSRDKNNKNFSQMMYEQMSRCSNIQSTHHQNIILDFFNGSNRSLESGKGRIPLIRFLHQLIFSLAARHVAMGPGGCTQAPWVPDPVDHILPIPLLLGFVGFQKGSSPPTWRTNCEIVVWPNRRLVSKKTSQQTQIAKHTHVMHY